MKTASLHLSRLSLALGACSTALFACGTQSGSSASASGSFSATTSGSAASAAADPASAAAGGEGTLPPALPPTEPAAPPGPEPVRWRACGHIGDRNINCAEVYVPLDHADPAGEQIAISINRVSANRAYPRRGVLLFNPGGPGESGKTVALDFLAEFDQVAPGFDVIGFDPRGVRDSGDRACAPSLAEMLPYGSKQAAVMSDFPELDAALAEARRCADTWGATFNKLGSNQAVRDIDWIRQALGEPKLNFLGVSYGTRLGSLYAHYFPETTGAIVIDAVVAPTVDWLQEARDTFDEQLRLTNLVLSSCESGAVEGCPTNARALFADLVADATELGLLGQVMDAWVDGISSAAGEANLLSILQAQDVSGGEWLLNVPPAAPASGESGLMPLATVNCIDATAEVPTVEQVEALYAQFQAESPAFSGAIINAIMCAGWPVTRDPVPLPTATEAPPLLVVGGAFDWRTPHAGAVAMTAALGNARLLTSNHVGHGALALGGDCAWSAMRNFFVDGVLPPEGTVCSPDTPPAQAPSPDRLPSSLVGARAGFVPR